MKLLAKKVGQACATALALGLLCASTANGSLSVHYQFVGKGNWSLDAVGSNNTEGPIGNLRAVVPPGSTVVKAFLYCTRTPGGSETVPTIVLDGTTYGTNVWTALGLNPTAGCQAFRADATAQVKAKIGSGSNSTNTFTVDSEDLNEETDGEALAIVYSNPAEKTRTIAFLDGFSASTGDSTQFSFSAPLVIGSGFEALMSLGIGFSYEADGSQQYSIVDIDGRRLTTSAGGEDDGISKNGGLITIGGIGDDPANPPDPYATPTNPRSDDELYNLAQGNLSNSAPFLVAGETSFTVNTLNPSGDDNIFFLGLNVTAKGSIGGGGGTCSTASDLLTQVDALGLARGQTRKLERQVGIIQSALDHRNFRAALTDCMVMERWLAALVRTGQLDPSAATSGRIVLQQCRVRQYRR